MPALTIDIQARLAQFQDSLDIVGKDAAKTAKQIGNAFSGLQNTLGAIGIGLSVAGIAGAIKSAIDFADQLNKVSQRVGVTTEALSGLAYAGKLADVEFDSLATGLKKLAVNMLDTQQGTGDAKDAFKALGINVEATRGVLKTSDQVLFELADKFAGIEDGAGKTALAVKIFGRAGAELIPLLNGGAEGLRNNAEEARRFGLIISSDAARAAEAFNDDLTRLKEGSRALSISIAQDLLPALQQFVDKLLFIKSLKDLDLLGKFFVLGTSNKNIGSQIVELERDLDDLIKKRERMAEVSKSLAGRINEAIPEFLGGSDLKSLDRQIASFQARLELLRKLGERQRTALDAEDAGMRPSPQKSKAPVLVDPSEMKRAEQLLEKFRDKLRSVQDEIAKSSGIDSSLLAMKRLVTDDKDFKAMTAAQKEQLLSAAETLDITKALKEQDKERLDAIQAGAEASQAWRNADTQAANAIRDQLDPLRARNRELAQARELMEAGRLSADEFKRFEIDPRVRELLTPLVTDFDRLLEALGKGQISEEQFRIGMERIKDKTEEAKDSARELGFVFQSAFEDAVLEGKKFSDVLKGLEKDIARIILRKTITEPIGRGVSDMIKGIDFGSIFGSIFGGARAGGGDVTAGRAYLVGEKRPELFVPGVSGTILPGVPSGDGGVTIVQNLSFGSNVDRGTLVQWARQVKQETIAAVVGARKRNIIPA